MHGKNQNLSSHCIIIQYVAMSVYYLLTVQYIIFYGSHSVVL